MLHSVDARERAQESLSRTLETFTTPHPGSSNRVAKELVTVETVRLLGHNAEMRATTEGRAVTAVGSSEGGKGNG